MVLSWPAHAEGYTLHSANDLREPYVEWPAVVEVKDGRSSAMISAPDSTWFFQLRAEP
jgi:hypothetical protein